MEKSEAHVFAYQNHFDSLSGAAKAGDEDFVADTFFGSAVVASACGCAGSFAHETHAVDRCCITADTFYGSVHIFSNFIHAANNDDVFGTEADGSNTVACAVNVDHDAVFVEGLKAVAIKLSGKKPLSRAEGIGGVHDNKVV